MTEGNPVSGLPERRQHLNLSLSLSSFAASLDDAFLGAIGG